MTRPYGKVLVATLEAADGLPPSTVAQIRQHMPIVHQPSAKYGCYWAVIYELMTEHGEKPKTYCVVPNWRQLVEQHNAGARERVPGSQRYRKPEPEQRVPAVTVEIALANRHPLERAWHNLT